MTIDGAVGPLKVGVTINGNKADHGLVLATGSGGSTVRGLAFVNTAGSGNGLRRVWR